MQPGRHPCDLAAEIRPCRKRGPLLGEMRARRRGVGAARAVGEEVFPEDLGALGVEDRDPGPPVLPSLGATDVGTGTPAFSSAIKAMRLRSAWDQATPLGMPVVPPV